MTQLIDHTKLSNVAIAIRTCYNSFGESKGCYERPTDELTKEDKELVLKVVKKFRHASTSEHCIFLFETTDPEVISKFELNKFTKTADEENRSLILTNLRVLLENPDLYQLVKHTLPKEFDFLFKEDENEI